MRTIHTRTRRQVARGKLSIKKSAERSSNKYFKINSSLRPERKRLRSVTPSEVGQVPDELRSPLAKRKRVAAERSGMSKLKTAVSADELTPAGDDDSPGNESSNPATPIQENGSNASFEGDDETEDGEEIDEDFLARELEEELG